MRRLGGRNAKNVSACTNAVKRVAIVYDRVNE